MTDREKDDAPDTSTDTSTDGSTGDTADVGISDDQLPEDLQPTDDNPLAKPPSDDDDTGMSLGSNGTGS